MKEIQFFDYDGKPISKPIKVGEPIYTLLTKNELTVKGVGHGYWADAWTEELETISPEAIQQAYNEYCLKNVDKLAKAREKRRQQFLKLKKEFE